MKLLAHAAAILLALVAVPASTQGGGAPILPESESGMVKRPPPGVDPEVVVPAPRGIDPEIVERPPRMPRKESEMSGDSGASGEAKSSDAPPEKSTEDSCRGR